MPTDRSGWLKKRIISNSSFPTIGVCGAYHPIHLKVFLREGSFKIAHDRLKIKKKSCPSLKKTAYSYKKRGLWR
jgi:hypothetical protein